MLSTECTNTSFVIRPGPRCYRVCCGNRYDWNRGHCSRCRRRRHCSIIAITLESLQTDEIVSSMVWTTGHLPPPLLRIPASRKMSWRTSFHLDLTLNPNRHPALTTTRLLCAIEILILLTYLLIYKLYSIVELQTVRLRLEFDL